MARPRSGSGSQKFARKRIITFLPTTFEARIRLRAKKSFLVENGFCRVFYIDM